VYDHLSQFLDDPMYWNHPRREDLQAMVALGKSLGRAGKSRYVVAALRATATILRTPACVRKTQSKGPDVAKEEIPTLAIGTTARPNTVADPNPPPIDETPTEDMVTEDVDSADDDADMKAAIEASVQEQQPASATAAQSTDLTDIDNSEDAAFDAEMKAAIQASLQQQQPSSAIAVHSDDDEDMQEARRASLAEARRAKAKAGGAADLDRRAGSAQTRGDDRQPARKRKRVVVVDSDEEE
jgi:hypothetical protein